MNGKLFNFSNPRIALVLAFLAGWTFAYSQFNLDGWQRLTVSMISLAIELLSIEILSRKKPLVAGH